MEDMTYMFSEDEIGKAKTVSALCYIPILFFLPLVTAQSRFGKFHANQSLILLLMFFIVNFIGGILGFLGLFNWFILGGLLSICFKIINAVLSLVCILGLVFAAQGFAKEFPVIGKIKLIHF
ncbi:MAG: hypothetical protein LBR54_02850 [Oscillospiraceae bacterium]|jgi:uncharacterized membrane protein|nr:hypothetical protein [Oscillospiraceae bacterium]